MTDTKTSFESWAVIELFGHTQLAGLVTEASIGGCSFVRVDVPAVNDRPAFTKFLGNGAIYSMTPVGESEARMAAERVTPRPVSTYLIPERVVRVSDERDELGNEDDDVIDGTEF